MTSEMKSGIYVAAVAGGLGLWLAILPDVAAGNAPIYNWPDAI